MGTENNDVILQVNNLRISFRAYGGLVKAVRGVSFDLKRGETVAVVGESGSGSPSALKPLWGFCRRTPLSKKVKFFTTVKT